VLFSRDRPGKEEVWPTRLEYQGTQSVADCQLLSGICFSFYLGQFLLTAQLSMQFSDYKRNAALLCRIPIFVPQMDANFISANALSEK